MKKVVPGALVVVMLVPGCAAYQKAELYPLSQGAGYNAVPMTCELLRTTPGTGAGWCKASDGALYEIRVYDVQFDNPPTLY